FLNKPFTSDLLIKTVETHMPKKSEEPKQPKPEPVEPKPEAETDFTVEQEPAYREATEVGPEVTETTEAPWWTPAPATEMPIATPAAFEPAAEQYYIPDGTVTGGAYFCGDTRFFSLNRALQIINHQRLTGTLRFFWDKQPVELLTQNGHDLLATSYDPGLYCPETLVTLSDIYRDRIASARAPPEPTV